MVSSSGYRDRRPSRREIHEDKEMQKREAELSKREAALKEKQSIALQRERTKAAIAEDKARTRMEARYNKQLNKAQNYANAYVGMDGMYGYPQSPSVLGAMLWTVALFVFLFILDIAVGPIDDYFTTWLVSPINAGNPYVSSVLPLFSWWYIFLIVSGAVGVLILWRAVITSILYGRFD